MHQKAAMSVDAQAREANACAQTLPLAEGLHPEQHYVGEACRVLGIEAVACRHAAATSTCAEKAQLLGWPPHRIVKALYFRDRGCYIGVVLPELSRRLDVAALLAAVLGLSRKGAAGFRMNGCPDGMEPGTCTPFPWWRAMVHAGGPIERLIIHREPALDGEQVDISLGGIGPSAHVLSGQLRDADLHAIAAYAFGARAVRVDFGPYLR